eukprot:scaffold7946_cov116-Isochrysis_galbana.AAC.10
MARAPNTEYGSAGRSGWPRLTYGCRCRSNKMAPGPRQAKMWKMWGELWEPALRRLSKCGNICSCLLLQRLGQYVPHFWVSLLPRCLELRGFARRLWLYSRCARSARQSAALFPFPFIHSDLSFSSPALQLKGTGDRRFSLRAQQLSFLPAHRQLAASQLAASQSALRREKTGARAGQLPEPRAAEPHACLTDRRGAHRYQASVRASLSAVNSQQLSRSVSPISP